VPIANRANIRQSPNGHVDPMARHLRPYAFHGVDLTPGGTHAVGECPFCHREGKFSVEVVTGIGRCWVCGTGTDAAGFNPLTFLRALHAHAVARTPPAFLAVVATDRKVLDPATVAAWGIACANDGTWLVPGYGVDGVLNQVYRRVPMHDGSQVLMPTPGVWPEGRAHALHMAVGSFDPARSALVVCEGPWDGVVLWEVYRDEFGDANVVAVPGCNVWRDEWTAFCRGKAVTLLYDSDHPRQEGGKTLRAGWDGMCRVARRLSGTAASVRVVRWGADGFDPTKKSGWDVRDHLTCQ